MDVTDTPVEHALPPAKTVRHGRPKGSRDSQPRCRRTRLQLLFDRMVGRDEGKFEASVRPQAPCPCCNSCYNVTWRAFSGSRLQSVGIQRDLSSYISNTSSG